MKNLVLLVLLVLLSGCDLETEQRIKDADVLRELIRESCKCDGGYTLISYNIDFTELIITGYSSADFRCTEWDKNKTRRVYINDEVNVKCK